MFRSFARSPTTSSARAFALQCMGEQTSKEATRLWLTLRPSTAQVE